MPAPQPTGQRFFNLIDYADILIRLRTTHQNKIGGHAVGHRPPLRADGTAWYSAVASHTA